MLTVLLSAVALVAGFALASCGSDETSAPTTDTTTTTTTTTTEIETETVELEQPTVVGVRLRDGVPVGGIVRRSVDKGDRVALVVDADTADEIHVHGYDITRNVAAGGRVRIAFRATIPGRFVVESHHQDAQIAELTVNP